MSNYWLLFDIFPESCFYNLYIIMSVFLRLNIMFLYTEIIILFCLNLYVTKLINLFTGDFYIIEISLTHHLNNTYKYETVNY